jgi:hypothetical protein
MVVDSSVRKTVGSMSGDGRQSSVRSIKLFYCFVAGIKITQGLDVGCVCQGIVRDTQSAYRWLAIFSAS